MNLENLRSVHVCQCVLVANGSVLWK